MVFHLMVYIRIVLTTLVIITCLLGDHFVDLTRHPLLRAFIDNATHAVIGALTGIAVIVQFYDKISNIFGWILILLCFLISSLIDVDHFIEARSFSLEDATAIVRRPMFHCSTIPLILFLIFIISSILNYFKLSLFLAIIFSAFFTHHTRDALRRGYWIYPFGNTERVPHLCYIFLTVATPYFIFYTYLICRCYYVQHLIGNYGKIYYNVPNSTYRDPISARKFNVVYKV